jgi:hypothetical protein
MVFPIGVEHALGVAVQCPHDATTVFAATRPAVKSTDRRRPPNVFLPLQKQNGSTVFKRQRDENC